MKAGARLRVWVDAYAAERYADAVPGDGFSIQDAGGPLWRGILTAAVPERESGRAGLALYFTSDGPYPELSPGAATVGGSADHGTGQSHG